MRRSIENRKIAFRGTPGRALEREVTLADGRQYTHRCSEATFRAVAIHLDENPGGFTLTTLADELDRPFTQVNVALELLKERGMLTTSGRRTYVEPGYHDGFFEHALTEFYALIEGCPPQYRAAGDEPHPSEEG